MGQWAKGRKNPAHLETVTLYLIQLLERKSLIGGLTPLSLSLQTPSLPLFKLCGFIIFRA